MKFKNSYYRLFNNPKINWMRFLLLLALAVIRALSPLIKDNRVNVFIVDDTIYERSSCKRTEPGSRVFDHARKRYAVGYRNLTPGWSDGNTFLPLAFSLLAGTQSNILREAESFDKRTLAFQLPSWQAGKNQFLLSLFTYAASRIKRSGLPLSAQIPNLRRKRLSVSTEHVGR